MASGLHRCYRRSLVGTALPANGRRQEQTKDVRDPIPYDLPTLRPDRTKAGYPGRMFRIPAHVLLQLGVEVQLPVLELAAVVGAAGAALAPKRANRGKKGVTSNGILSRAEVMATGAVFTISALSSQGLTFTRPPKGRAAI